MMAVEASHNHVAYLNDTFGDRFLFARKHNLGDKFKIKFDAHFGFFVVYVAGNASASQLHHCLIEFAAIFSSPRVTTYEPCKLTLGKHNHTWIWLPCFGHLVKNCLCNFI